MPPSIMIPCGHYTPMSFFLYIVPWFMWAYANQKNYNVELVSWHQTTTCLQPPSQLGSSKLTTMVSWKGSIGLASPSIVEPTFKSRTYEANSRMNCSPTFKRMDSNRNDLSRNGWIFETSHVQTSPQTWVSFSIELNYCMLQVLSSCACLIKISYNYVHVLPTSNGSCNQFE